MSTHQLSMTAILAIGITIVSSSAMAEKQVGTSGVQANIDEANKKPLQKDLKLPAKALRKGGTASVPGIGKQMGRKPMEQHNAARAAREMQQIQKMREAQGAMQPGSRAATPRDNLGSSGANAHDLRERAAGTRNRSSGGSATSGNGSSDRRSPGGGVTRDTGPGHYRTEMHDSATAKRPGALSTQPSSPASGANMRDSGQANWGGKTRGTSKLGSSKNVYVDSSGNRHTVTTATGKDKSTRTIAETRRPDGASRRHETTTRADGSSTTTMVERDNKGHAVRKEMTERDRDGTVVKHTSSGAAGDPGVHDGSVSGDGNCNWNPVLGRCTKTQTSHKDMTRRPGPGQDGSTTADSGSTRPRLGNEAVTNPGDGSWSAGRSGGTGGGRPLDMRDPPKGIPDSGPAPR